MPRGRRATTDDATEGTTVQTVKNSLKYAAAERDRVLTVRLGVKKLVLPVKARVIASGDYLFLSFPASTEIYKIEGKELASVDDAGAVEARDALRATKKRGGGRRKKSTEMTDEMQKLLAAIPTGHRLGYDREGNAKLVKTRPRRKGAGSAAE